jgi:hypothetical protein
VIAAAIPASINGSALLQSRTAEVCLFGLQPRFVYDREPLRHGARSEFIADRDTQVARLFARFLKLFFRSVQASTSYGVRRIVLN